MSGDSSQFEGLSTHRLESILRKSLTDGSLTPEDLLAISGILERRDAGKGKGPPDVKAAWDRFLEKQRGLPPGFASGEEVPSETFSKTIPSKVRNLGGLHFFSRQRISNNTGFEL